MGVKNVPATRAHAAPGERGAGGVGAEQILGGQDRTAGPLPQRAEAGKAAQKLQTRRLQTITGQLPVRETIMRWYRHRSMDLPEEYMRCHCDWELETYDEFMRREVYKEIDMPLIRDQDIPLLKKGEK